MCDEKIVMATTAIESYIGKILTKENLVVVLALTEQKKAFELEHLELLRKMPMSQVIKCLTNVQALADDYALWTGYYNITSNFLEYVCLVEMVKTLERAIPLAVGKSGKEVLDDKLLEIARKMKEAKGCLSAKSYFSSKLFLSAAIISQQWESEEMKKKIEEESKK